MKELGVWSGFERDKRGTSWAPMGAQLTGVISSFRAVAADSITVWKPTTSPSARRKGGARGEAGRLPDAPSGCIMSLAMEFALNRLRG